MPSSLLSHTSTTDHQWSVRLRCGLLLSSVHSDLNPKNLLLDPDTLEVTGVLDWEFCHSGHPFTDLGNLLRFDREPAYAEAVLEAWCDRRPTDPGDALELARSADLVALVDLAVRSGTNPVATAAGERLRAIARARGRARDVSVGGAS